MGLFSRRARRIAGVAALALVAGCPRPGLAPETESVATDCTPGTKEACYSGPEGTEGIGACAAGERECDASGAWGACAGETLPLVEACVPEGGEIADLDCDGSPASACPIPIVFATVSEPGFDVGASLALAGGGRVLWGGMVSHLSGNPDAFVTLLEEDGTVVWTYEELKGPGLQSVASVAVSGESYYGAGMGLFANADTDGFVQRLDADGLFGERSLVASPGPDAVGVIAPAEDPEGGGGVFVAGTVGGTADVPEGAATFGDADDLYVMRIREDGFAPWNMVCLGDGKASSPRALVHDEARSKLYLGITVSASITVPFAPPADPVALLPSANDPSDAAVYVIDETKPDEAPVTHLLVFRSTGADTIDAIAAASDGSLYIAGSYTGQDLKLNGVSFLSGDPDGLREGFVARVTPEGTVVWAKRFGGPGNQRFHTLFAAGETLLVGGTFDAAGVLAGEPITWTSGIDFVLARLDAASGDFESAEASQGSGDEYVTSIVVDAKGGTWITGDFSADLSFAGETATANGDYDAYLFRLPP